MIANSNRTQNQAILKGARSPNARGAARVIDLSELNSLYDLFYVAAYGCNRQCEQEIRKAFYAHNRPMPVYMFFEFFATQPLPKSTPAGWPASWQDETYLLTPFAPRLVQHSVQTPTIDEGGKVISRYRSCRPKENGNGMLTWALPFPQSNSVKHVFEWWRNDSEGAKSEDGKTAWQDICDQETGKTRWCGFVNDVSWDYLSKKPAQAKDPKGSYLVGLEDDQIGKQYGAALKELLRPLMSGVEGDPAVPGLMVPICSSRLFYGGIWVVLQGLTEEENQEPFRQALALRLLNVADRVYAPALALLHEHLLEGDSLKKFKENPRAFTEDVAKNHAIERKIHMPGKERSRLCCQRNVFYGLPKLPRSASRTKETVDEIESLFARLWDRRSNHEVWGNAQHFKDSHIFSKYLLCSEAMLKLLYQVIRAAKTVRKVNDTLPACLVIGGAGTGKEKLARMVRLFADDCKEDGVVTCLGYHRGKEFVVNLASIRPAPLTAAVMSGVNQESFFRGVLPAIVGDAERHKAADDDKTNLSTSEVEDLGELPFIVSALARENDSVAAYIRTRPEMRSALEKGNGKVEPATLKAALQQVIDGEMIYEEDLFSHVALSEQTSKLLRKPAKGPEIKRLNWLLLRDAWNQREPAALRLDEFNSMDPDSQGVLLRFLDDSQVIGLGEIKERIDKDKTNCLVIGIMNEDPEEISREKAMEFMKNPYLGGLLGDVLYEHFMKIRRLRPDVMYRMMRNGKFEIPALTRRREDIPLLFYFFVTEELRADDSSKASRLGDKVQGDGAPDNKKKRVLLPLEVLDRLVERDLGWPGNVRQLQALAKFVVQRMKIRREGDGPCWVVTLDLLEEALEEVGLVPQNAQGKAGTR